MCIWLAPAAAWAQSEQHQHGGMAPKDIGTVSFETSCSPATKTKFNEAVALLHSFWFAESRAIFESVLKDDPNCAMAYWGIALTHWGNPFAGQRVGADDRERQGGDRQGTRHRIADAARERLHRGGRDPVFEQRRDDAARSACSITRRRWDACRSPTRPTSKRASSGRSPVAQAASPTDKTYARNLQAAEMLEPLSKQMPKHPGIAHYIIHAYDVPPLAPKALPRGSQLRRHRARRAARAPHALAHIHARRLLEGIGRQQRQVGRDRREDQRHRRGDACARLS